MSDVLKLGLKTSTKFKVSCINLGWMKLFCSIILKGMLSNVPQMMIHLNYCKNHVYNGISKYLCVRLVRTKNSIANGSFFFTNLNH